MMDRMIKLQGWCVVSGPHHERMSHLHARLRQVVTPESSSSVLQQEYLWQRQGCWLLNLKDLEQYFSPSVPIAVAGL